MTRVAAFGNYQTAMLNLMSAQQRGQKAQIQLASGKQGTSLVEFGRNSEAITALKSTQSRVTGFLETAKATADRLTTQDIALERVGASATDARIAISNALAAGRGEGLMTELQALFQSISDGINTRHHGRYVFSGGAVDTRPTAIAGLDALAEVGDIAASFENDRLIQTSWIDENVVLETGVLADGLGSELYEIFKEIAVFAQARSPNGKVAGTLAGQFTDEERDFLSGIVGKLDIAARNVVSIQATNGAAHGRTESIVDSHIKRADALEVMLSGKTDADAIKAATELEMSELAIQASAQVIARLRQVSLLDYLR